ncbi:hypothetical protein Hte_003812 [Hypoxylon texense]
MASSPGLAAHHRCNEAKPVCHNCLRFGLPCVYDRDAFTRAPEKSTAAQVPPTEAEDDDPLEGRTRRVIETKLMHQYLVETGSSIAADEHTRELFARVVPKLSFESDALLYSMYAIAAVHLQRLGRGEELEGDDEDVANRYSSMAIREHNKEIPKMNRQTTDAVCLASCLMRCIARLQLEGRSMQPYTPPWQWLVLSQTSASTFMEAWEKVGPDPGSVRRNLGRLKHLLHRPEEVRMAEPWDPEIEDAYAHTLDYICTAIDLLDNEGPAGGVFRMLIMFPMLVGRRFVEEVKAGPSRALVILAHYFALLVGFEDNWCIGSIGADEVRAIISALPDQWQGLLTWPKKAIEKYWTYINPSY